MTDKSGGREGEEKAGPAVARVSPVTQITSMTDNSPGATHLSPPPSYKVNITFL